MRHGTTATPGCRPLRGALGLLALALLPAPAVHAQQMEARSYSNAPVGLNFVLAGYVRQEGDVALDAAAPVQDLDAQGDFGLVGFAHVLRFGGQSGVFAVALPFGSLQASGKVEGVPRDVTRVGVGDPGFRISVNLHGAPALSLEEFRDFHQDTIVGVSLAVTLPWGEYEPERLINLGTNRYSFRPEVGVSKKLGSFTLELAGGLTLFTPNHEFLGENDRRQSEMVQAQGHAIYNIDPRTWASLDLVYYTGGETSVNGEENDDRQENSRWGVTFSRSVSRDHSLKLYYSDGATVRAGTDFTTAGVAWQYRWGAGL